MDCPACGVDNRDGARFCRMCGRDLPRPEKERESEAQTAGEPLAAAPNAGVRAAGSLLEEPVPETTAGTEGPEALRPASPTAGPPPGPPAPRAEWAPGRLEEPELEAHPAASPPEEPPAVVGAGPGEGQGPEAEGIADLAEAPALVPASPGTRLVDRFLVVETLEAQPHQILYLAQDLQRCWQCAFEGNSSGDTFCAQCGASLEPKPEVRLLQVRDGAEEPVGAGPSTIRFTGAGYAFFLLGGPPPKSDATSKHPGLRLLGGHRSDTGRVRELDEDSLFVLNLAPSYGATTGPVLGLFAVADGMGGHEGGEVASKMALHVVTDLVLRTILLPETTGLPAPEEAIIARLREAATAANDAVYLARQKRKNDMGTTLTLALIRDDRLFLAHVGDCRAYRWNAGGLHQLTADHSLVANMAASGQIQPDEIYTHPHRSIIYRCIGDQPEVEVDTEVMPIGPGDRIILCSDGLWEMVRNEGIEEVMMRESDPQAACDLLVTHANAAGGDDNISVIVVLVEAMGSIAGSPGG